MTSTLSRDQKLAELDARSEALNDLLGAPEQTPRYEVLASVDKVGGLSNKYGKHIQVSLTIDLNTASAPLLALTGEMVTVIFMPHATQLKLPEPEANRRQFDGRVG